MAEPEEKADNPQRILIVDDDPDIIESVRYALENNAYQVLVARDGNQGLAMAEREDPDLIILDVMLPELDGFEVCRTLRARGDLTPILMLTAPWAFCPGAATHRSPTSRCTIT